MPHYRFYRLDADSKIVEGIDAECLDDEAAHLAARDILVSDARGEIWSGTRFVGRFPHTPRALT